MARAGFGWRRCARAVVLGLAAVCLSGVVACETEVPAPPPVVYGPAPELPALRPPPRADAPSVLAPDGGVSPAPKPADAGAASELDDDRGGPAASDAGDGGAAAQGCVDDGFEPNDARAEATPLGPGVPLEAVACPADADFYRFTPPVAVGEVFVVTVGFTHALGDIDARLVSLSSGATLASGQGLFDDERLSAAADGGDFELVVFLFGDGDGNAYRVSVDTPALAPDNDCCGASDEPGCSDPRVNACTCLADPTCCTEAFDDVCVEQARAECGASCEAPPPESDCCSSAAAPGCSAPEVAACVCDIDPFCCAGPFDDSCVNLARGLCGAVCEQ